MEISENNECDELMDNMFDGLQGKRIAITGGNGYIGSALVENLQKNSIEVIRICRKKIPSIVGVIDIIADIRMYDIWPEVVDRADVIICLAGNTSVYAAEKDVEENLHSTLLPLNNLIKAVKKSNKIPRVVYASTVTVYGMTSEFPVSETAKENPITTYDLHKLFAEQLLEMATRQGFLSSVSLRLANVYGPSLTNHSASDRGVLNKIVCEAVNGKDLQVFGSGDYLRDYIYIDDVTSAFIYASHTEGLEGRSFNISNGIGYTLNDAFELVVKETSSVIGKNIKVDHVPWPEEANQIEYRNFVGNNSLFSEMTKWTPQVSLEVGIRKLIDVFQERL